MHPQEAIDALQVSLIKDTEIFRRSLCCTDKQEFIGVFIRGEVSGRYGTAGSCFMECSADKQGYRTLYPASVVCMNI